ncbi:mediator of RNA polymerase II transcription subunit 15a-like [Curcuma longa]|uniref:mediator of RNA polymerase II transcription subunit 15a-like n=1 Tax=Curcuma longa TaxID=136217 RepID=UPI003D9E6BC4
MEGNSDQGKPSAVPDGSSGDWRTLLQPDARRRITNKIMDTLKRHLPISVPEGLNELQKIAIRFEEKIYAEAANQSDYLRKISLKMMSMESKSQHFGGPGQMIPSTSNNLYGNQNPVHSQESAQKEADAYSIASCMDILNSIPDVSIKAYLAACDRFCDPAWRDMFVKMPDHRRLQWLELLDLP